MDLAQQQMHLQDQVFHQLFMPIVYVLATVVGLVVLWMLAGMLMEGVRIVASELIGIARNLLRPANPSDDQTLT